MAMRGCAFVIGHRLPVQELLELGAPEDLGHFGAAVQQLLSSCSAAAQ